jgi:hypothetical protein
MSTYDMREESTFIHWSGMLETLPHLRASVKSAFRGLDLTRLALEIEPPGVDRERIARDPAAAERRLVRGNMMKREDDCLFEWDEPVAFGDLDGDGWEDMLLISGGGASQGTMCSYGCYAVARRADGLIVSIAGRMPDGLVPARVMEARRAEWRANFGLPVNEWIELRGTCGCGPIDLAGRVHPLRVRLRSEGGYLSGSYSCDLNPRDIRLAGALWTKDEGMLHEFGIDRCATATIGFDWSVEGGCLSIKGRRCGSGHIETDDWSASGPLRKESLGGQAR